jgi:adenosine deaminase
VDNPSGFNEIPARKKERQVPGDGGEGARRDAARPDEPEAEELLAGAPSGGVAEQEQEAGEHLCRPEARVEARGGLRRDREDPEDDARRDEEGATRDEQEIHAEGGGAHPEALARRRAERDGARLEDTVRCGPVRLAPSAVRFLRRFAAARAVELHLHLEGSVSAAALVRLSSRAPAPIFPDLASVRARRRSLGSPEAFFGFYRDVCRQIRSPGDYALVARALTARLVRERIRHAEVYVSPAVAETLGLEWPAVREALEGVFAAHEAAGNGRILVLLDVVRHWGPASAARVLDLADAYPWPRVVGFGLGGEEAAFPARDFAEAFRRARRMGLMPVAHAGEWAGAESVAETLAWLQPVRIAHGIRAAEDAALLRALARRGIVCDVCPTSNLATGAVPAGSAHPVRALLAAGVPVTLSTDDPGLFGTTLRAEFRRVAGWGATGRELAACARTARQAAARTRSYRAR